MAFSRMKGLNPLIAFWKTMMDAMGTGGQVIIPTDFHNQADAIEDALKNDVTGLVNTNLNFMINAASSVDIWVEADDLNITKKLNKWLQHINEDMSGRKVESGVQPLSRQYFRELWARSSFIAMKNIYDKEIEGFKLPNTMYLYRGGSVWVAADEDTYELGSEKYYLKLGNDETKKKYFTNDAKNQYYVQFPIGTQWSEFYPTPYLVRQGILENMMFGKIMSGKQEKIVNQALPYMLNVLKGSDVLTKDANITYTEAELKQIDENISEFAKRANTGLGSTQLVNNYDTKIEHVIPEYKKIMDENIFIPIERRILHGFGQIEIIQGTSSSRREAILNPKPMVEEIKAGIEGYKQLIKQVLIDVVKKNGDKLKLNNLVVKSSPCTTFIDSNLRDHYRRMYERGVLSKETYVEVCGDSQISYTTEVKGRMGEIERGEEILMYPPVIQNMEQNITDEETEHEKLEKIKPTEDKNGAEDKKQNKADYVASSEEGKIIGQPIDPTVSLGADFDLTDEELAKELVTAPYQSVKDISPKISKHLSPSSKKAFKDIFNHALKHYGDEKTAFRVTWNALKKISSKNKQGKWSRKQIKQSYTRASFEEALNEIKIEIENLKEGDK